MKKIQGKILLVLFLGLILVGVNFLSQQNKTPDYTANWKTYINTKYGYSVKYPPTLNHYPDFKEITGREDLIVFKKLSVVDIDSSLKIGVNERQECNLAWGYDVSKQRKPIDISGVSGSLFQDNHYGKVFLNKNRNCYFIYFQDSSLGSESLFDQILSTFRFE